MYLTELYRFFVRKSSDPNSGMPPEGMSSEQISFIFEINDNGELFGQPIDIRCGKERPVRCFVPASVKRSINIASNFLWDNSGYVLGVDDKGQEEKTKEKHKAFREFNRTIISGCSGRAARAFLNFLDKWTPEQFQLLDQRESILDSNIAFRLKDEKKLLHEDQELKNAWITYLKGDEYSSLNSGVCLVTGQHAAIALTHPSIKNLPEAQSSGASLVSFNCPSFESYGKKQSMNAPVSKEAARGYASALNYLLQREHRQVVNLKGTSVVFWAEKNSPAETILYDFFDLSDQAKETQDTPNVKECFELLEGLRRENSPGEYLSSYLETKLFVLGLAPNAARISIRFWLVDTLGHICKACADWYDDLSVVRQNPAQPKYPPMWLILAKTLAVQEKKENIPDNLAGQLLQCFLISGRLIPETVFSMMLQRIHADKKMDYYRAALAKAYLIRNCGEEKDMTVLNLEEQNMGYRLGRLFSVLEKTQKDALGGSVSTPLRERYIGSASSNPRLVFPLLMSLSQHHVTKVRKSGREWYEAWFVGLVGSIVADITEYPAVLSLENQGRFMLGYYHQTNAFYTKKKNAQETDNSEGQEN